MNEQEQKEFVCAAATVFGALLMGAIIVGHVRASDVLHPDQDTLEDLDVMEAEVLANEVMGRLG